MQQSFSFINKNGFVYNLLGVCVFSLFFLNFCSSGPCSLLSQPPLRAAGIATTEKYGMCDMKNQFYSLAFHTTYKDAISNFWCSWCSKLQKESSEGLFIIFCTSCVFLFQADELNNSLSCTDSELALSWQ